jgi:signal transduction histidine kinase
MLDENVVIDETTISESGIDVVDFVNQLADAAILVGPDRVISASNMHVNRLFGWDEPGLTGQLIDVLIPTSVGTSHPDWVSSFFERPASRSMSENPLIEGIRKNGERVQIDISLTPVAGGDSPQILAIIHDNSKSARGYSQRSVELTALSEISKLTKSGLDSYEIVTRVARQARNLIPYDRLVVVVFDQLNSTAHDWLIAGHDTDDDAVAPMHKLTTEQIKEYLTLNEPFIVRSANSHSLLSSMESNVTRFEEGYRSLLCVPLIWNNEILGVINIRSKSATAYDDESLRIAIQIGSVVATVLGRVKLQSSQAQAEQRRNALTAISKIAANASNIDSVFDAIAIPFDLLIPIDRMVLSSVNLNTNRYQFEAEWGVSNPATRPGISRPLASTASLFGINARETVSLTSDQISEFSTFSSPGWHDPVNEGSWLVTPVILRGKPVGVIHFRNNESNAYTDEHANLATQVAPAFASALGIHAPEIDNNRERRIRNAVITLNRRVIEGESLESLSEATQELVSKFLDFDRFSTVTIDVNASESTVVYQTGISVNPGSTNNKMAYSGMADSGSSQLGHIDQLPSPWSDTLKEAGLNSWMYMTIGGEANDPIGAIWVSAERKNAFSARDLEIIERIGGVIAPAFHRNALSQSARRLEEERTRAESLSTQTAVLESEARAKSEFISSISHEFKTPLTSVVAFSSLLMRDKSMGERQLRQLELIQNNAWRLERMIDDLLHVAAADSGGLSFDIKEVDVVSIVQEVTDGLKPVANSTGKRLVLRASTAHATAAVDAVRMAQSIQNIVSNAIKYSPANSGITISTCENAGHIEILVRNKGKLAEADAERAFSRFTRLDNEITRGTPGTGLGLSITREILDEMGGTITLMSDQKCIEARIRVPILAQ